MNVRKKIAGLYKWPVNLKESSDSGMALTLLLLLIGLFTGATIWYWIAIPVLAMNMIFPAFYRPWGWFWLGTTRLLGTVVSKLILTIIYIVFVVPVGVIRQLAGKDPLNISKFKKGGGSVLVVRDTGFGKTDLEKPF